ncbi:hypothetical protein IC232_13795 [Microvirga sp. BT688]|uniref:hypothetical protein n=1 Tax=Microvirga sp. TaxID=1873136 RepID=UPI001682715E|nr:hypothetical protein [Microvirga sp.]MBD2747772.1 hypothetical protein [Microvirga sp.]
MTRILISDHAETRAAQRGASEECIALVLAHGDIEYPAACGRRIVRLSHQKAGELLTDDVPFRVVDHARSIALVVGAADQVITVLRCDPTAPRRKLDSRCRRRSNRR